MKALNKTAKGVLFVAVIAGSAYAINTAIEWWNEREAKSLFEDARRTLVGQPPPVVAATTEEQKLPVPEIRFGGRTPEQVSLSLVTLGATANISLRNCQATAELDRALHNLSMASNKLLSCAQKAESDLQPFLKDVREALHSNNAATALLRDWYSTWVTNLTSDDSSYQEHELEEKLNKLKTEVQWSG